MDSQAETTTEQPTPKLVLGNEIIVRKIRVAIFNVRKLFIENKFKMLSLILVQRNANTFKTIIMKIKGN